MRLLTWMSTAIVASALLGLGPAPVVAQQDLDSVKADATHHKVEFENAEVRVVRWVIPPGGKTAQHSHPNNVNVFLTDADAKVTTPDGKTTEAHGKAGQAVWRGATTHVVENIGKKPAEGILIEPKRPHSAMPAGVKDDFTANPKLVKVEFENEQVRILRYRIGAGEKTNQHGHPDNVQVLLTDHKANVTTSDGKTVAGAGKAGEVRWRPAGVHTVQNTGDKPFEGILVEMKGGGGTSKPAGQ